MDIPLDDLIRFLTPLLPYLLRAGERAAEEAGRRIAGDAWDSLRSLWTRARNREPLQQAAQDLTATPDDPDALVAFRYQLRRALAEDPALAEELAALWKTREVHVYIHHLPPPAPERPRPLHNLPQPDYVRFVGRERELAWLRGRLSPRDRAWILLLTGIGGVGKTALALAIAHEYRQRYEELPPQERFEAIVWASAKEQVLTPSGPEAAGPPGLVSHTLAEVYRAIAQALDREAITRAAPEDQDREVQKALTAQRTLLVLDNLDTMDDAVRAFLRNLPAPTKAIITSREWLNVADVLTVRGMEREEALALIEAEAEPRGLALTPEQKERLWERTAGLPLPIRLSVARLGAGETFEGVMRWLGNATGDLPQYCVGGQVELARRRNPDAYRLLLACSLFDRDAGASREALGEIADLSIADRDEGLALLERLNLVNRTASDRFWMLPMVQEYVQARLEKEEFGPVLIERWLGWALEFARKWGADLDIHTTDAPLFAPEYPNLIRAVHWCYEHKQWHSLVHLANDVWFFPYLTGLLGDLQQMWDMVMEAVRATGDERTEGRFWRRRATLLWIRGNYQEAKECLDRAESFAQRNHDLIELGEIWHIRADILDKEGAFQEAKQLSQRALQAGEQTGSLKIKVLAAYRLAEREAEEGNFEAAHKWLDQGEAWAKELGWPRALAWYAELRGANLVQEGRYAEAEPSLLQSVEMATTWGEYRLIGVVKSWLAVVYQALHRPELAKRVAEEALDILQRIGIAEGQARARKVLQGLSGENV